MNTFMKYRNAHISLVIRCVICRHNHHFSCLVSSLLIAHCQQSTVYIGYIVIYRYRCEFQLIFVVNNVIECACESMVCVTIIPSTSPIAELLGSPQCAFQRPEFLETFLRPDQSAHISFFYTNKGDSRRLEKSRKWESLFSVHVLLCASYDVWLTACLFLSFNLSLCIIFLVLLRL